MRFRARVVDLLMLSSSSSSSSSSSLGSINSIPFEILQPKNKKKKIEKKRKILNRWENFCRAFTSRRNANGKKETLWKKQAQNGEPGWAFLAAPIYGSTNVTQPPTVAMQSGSSVGICCMHIFALLAPVCSCCLLTKISASELSWKFIKSALLVGQSLKL